jgi:AcrR family transcriptional regulator
MPDHVAPGRPRDPEADRAILAATLEVLGESGFTALSVEGVAARAGVGKATIYRRYQSKEELVTAALGSVAEDVDAPDSGDTRADVEELAVAKWSAMTSGPGPTLLGTFLAQSAARPELMDEFRRVMMQPKQKPLRDVLRRGITRGELAPDLDLDIAVDLIIGPLLAGFVIRGDSDPESIRQRVRAVWPALASRTLSS